ncbi:hypothetical protein, partial [Desulfocurvus sp. DL9XJH121]
KGGRGGRLEITPPGAAVSGEYYLCTINCYRNILFCLHINIALHKKTRTGKRYFKIGIPDWIELHTGSIVSLYLTIEVSIIPFLYDKELHFDAECILAFMLYFLIISTSFALFLGPHIIKNVDYIWGCSEIYDDYFYYSSILSLYKINRIKLKNIKKFRRTADRLAHGWVSIRTQDGKMYRDSIHLTLPPLAG